MNDKGTNFYFIDKVVNRLEEVDSHLCVGLDMQYECIPD